MTKEEILAVEAGEELDRLVAETFDDFTDREEYGDRIYHHLLLNKEGGWEVPAPVSTDISAA